MPEESSRQSEPHKLVWQVSAALLAAVLAGGGVGYVWSKTDTFDRRITMIEVRVKAIRELVLEVVKQYKDEINQLKHDLDTVKKLEAA